MFWLYPLGCAPQVVLDFEATCASAWPTDSCAGDGCADTDTELRWVAAFAPAFAEEARIPEASVGDYARVRSITASTFQSPSRASWQADIDWVRVVGELELWTDTPSPGDGELSDRWRDWMGAPAMDLDTELMPYDDVQRFVDDCAEQLGVTFDGEGWCQPWFPTDWDDDDAGLRFDFSAELEGNEYALASIRGRHERSTTSR